MCIELRCRLGAGATAIPKTPSQRYRSMPELPALLRMVGIELVRLVLTARSAGTDGARMIAGQKSGMTDNGQLIFLVHTIWIDIMTIF